MNKPINNYLDSVVDIYKQYVKNGVDAVKNKSIQIRLF